MSASSSPDGSASPAAPRFTLRPYQADRDREASLELWRATWQVAFPSIDFTARLPWWRERWTTELEPAFRIIVGDIDDGVAGFTVVNVAARYLDQIVVGPRAWGTGLGRALMDDAKAVCPSGLLLDVNKDNARAVAFYAREGFVVTGETVNPRSGLPVLKLAWTPESVTPISGNRLLGDDHA